MEYDVAVIGAAGQTGRPLVRSLAGRGAKVKALVRRMDQAPLIPEAKAVEAVDLKDVAGLTAALGNVAVAYYIPPVFSPWEERFGSNVIAAAVAAKLPRLVYHSVLHAPTPAMPHHRRKSMVELALRESPLVWTIMQPAMYAQSVLAFLNPKRNLLTVGFNPNKQFTPIDLEDLGEAATNVLLGDGHEYATYELAGADRLTFAEMAEAITRVLGWEVGVRQVPSALVAGVATTRFGPKSIPVMKAMLDHYNAHGLVGNASVLRMALQRQPTSFTDTMRRELTGPFEANGE